MKNQSKFKRLSNMLAVTLIVALVSLTVTVKPAQALTLVSETTWGGVDSDVARAPWSVLMAAHVSSATPAVSAAAPTR